MPIVARIEVTGPEMGSGTLEYDEKNNALFAFDGKRVRQDVQHGPDVELSLNEREGTLVWGDVEYQVDDLEVAREFVATVNRGRELAFRRSARQSAEAQTQPSPEQRTTPEPATVSAPESSGGPGFFGRLFDVSMKSFITPSLIRLLFVLGIILITLSAIALLAAGAQDNGVWIVIAPIYWLLGVIYLRVILEVILVFFRIEENTRPRG